MTIRQINKEIERLLSRFYGIEGITVCKRCHTKTAHILSKPIERTYFSITIDHWINGDVVKTYTCYVEKEIELNNLANILNDAYDYCKEQNLIIGVYYMD